MATTDDELLELEQQNEALRATREELKEVPVDAAANDAREARKEHLLREQAALKAEVEWAAAAASGEVIVAKPRDKESEKPAEPEKPAETAKSPAEKAAEKAAAAKSAAESAAAKPAGEEK